MNDSNNYDNFGYEPPKPGLTDRLLIWADSHKPLALAATIAAVSPLCVGGYLFLAQKNIQPVPIPEKPPITEPAPTYTPLEYTYTSTPLPPSLTPSPTPPPTSTETAPIPTPTPSPTPTEEFHFVSSPTPATEENKPAEVCRVNGVDYIPVETFDPKLLEKAKQVKLQYSNSGSVTYTFGDNGTMVFVSPDGRPLATVGPGDETTQTDATVQYFFPNDPGKSRYDMKCQPPENPRRQTNVRLSILADAEYILNWQRANDVNPAPGAQSGIVILAALSPKFK